MLRRYGSTPEEFVRFSNDLSDKILSIFIVDKEVIDKDIFIENINYELLTKDLLVLLEILYKNNMSAIKNFINIYSQDSNTLQKKYFN